MSKKVSLENSKSNFLFVSLFILFSAMFATHANPFKGEVVAPLDLLMKHEGWSSRWDDLGYEGQLKNWQRSDLLDGRYPLLAYYKNYLNQGIIPTWHIDSNTPIYYTPLNIALNPQLLPFMVLENHAYAIHVGVMLQLIIAALGMFVLARLAMNTYGALFAALTYMLSGFGVGWIFDLTVQIWIPWVIWAVVVYLSTNNRRYLPFITLFSALLIYSLFYSVAGYTFYLASFIVLVWQLVAWMQKEVTIRQVALNSGLIFAFITLAFILAIANFAPFFDVYSYADMSWRSNPTPSPVSDMFLLWDPLYKGPIDVEHLGYSGKLAVILGILGLPFLFLCRDNKINFRMSFIFALALAIAMMVLYGLIPKDLVLRIPLFDFNPWNRLYAIIGFCLAFLAGNAVHILTKTILSFRFRYATVVAAVVFLGLYTHQMEDQKRLFRRLNAVVPSTWYYPETPTLSYVQRHSVRHQSVVADMSYLMGGTLGVYGISEWFAHTYFSEKEKELLGQVVDKPFTSPFSARFAGLQMNVRSEYLDVFGIRYLLMHRNDADYLIESRDLDSGLKVFSEEENIVIVENLSAPEGAYLVSDLSQHHSQIMKDGISIEDLSDKEFVVTYTGEETGFIVAPIRHYPQWRAYDDNGAEIKLESYLGIFPAAKVSGPSQLRFRFEPPNYMQAYLLSGLGLVVLLLLTVFIYRGAQILPNREA